MAVQLLIFQNGGSSGTEITNLVQEIRWKGRKGSAARSLTVKLIDDDGYKHARSGIDVESGYQCILYEDAAELFRGLIMRTTQTDRKSMTFVAYDYGIYLSNNKDTFVYENKTASAIFTDVCNRFSLTTGSVANCSYSIPSLIKKATTAWDVIADALSLDFQNTGTRHYVKAEGGNLSLITRKNNILQWVIEPERNLSSYSYERSIEDIKTRIKLYSDENTVVASKSNSSLEAKIGIFQNVDTPDETLNAAQINQLCATLLTEQSAPAKTLTLDDVPGISDIISGVGVFIIIPHLDLSCTFYVDEDTHIFDRNRHYMNLTLNYTDDV